ncbi:hypothetical protein AAC387_Pa07g0439 [Persea americana]
MNSIRSIRFLLGITSDICRSAFISFIRRTSSFSQQRGRFYASSRSISFPAKHFIPFFVVGIAISVPFARCISSGSKSYCWLRR